MMTKNDKQWTGIGIVLGGFLMWVLTAALGVFGGLAALLIIGALVMGFWVAKGTPDDS